MKNIIRYLFLPVLIVSIFGSCRKGNSISNETPTPPVVVEEKGPVVEDDLEFRNYISGLEIPSIQDKRPSVIVSRASYTCSFNKETRCANWVAWFLSENHTDGPYRRKNLHIQGWYVEDLPTLEGRQLLSDWNGIEGYDHGHLCPSGDNKWNLEAMRQTYYLSNMCVQNQALNQGPWEHLESTCRGWARAFGGLYIVAGPIFTKNPIKKVGDGLSVPDRFFKVILCVGTNETKAIGFLYDNIDPPVPDRLPDHCHSIDEIEAITGIDFFPSLPDDVEEVVESDNDITKWRLR